MILGKDCEQKFFSMLQLCVFLDLLQLVSLLTIYAVEQNVVAYCHAYIYGKRTKVGTLVEMIRYYTSKDCLYFADIKLGS